MSIRYLDLSGAVNFWTNIKNYILSKIPTKTSELTNDSGFLTNTDTCLHKSGGETFTGYKTVENINSGLIFKSTNYQAEIRLSGNEPYDVSIVSKNLSKNTYSYHTIMDRYGKVFPDIYRLQASNLTVYVSNAVSNNDGDGLTANTAFSYSALRNFLGAIRMQSGSSLGGTYTLTINLVPTGISYGICRFDSTKMPYVKNLIIQTSTGVEGTPENYTTNCPELTQLCISGNIDVTVKNIKCAEIVALQGTKITLSNFNAVSYISSRDNGYINIGGYLYVFNQFNSTSPKSCLFEASTEGHLRIDNSNTTIHFSEQCYYSAGLIRCINHAYVYGNISRWKILGIKPSIINGGSTTVLTTCSTPGNVSAKTVETGTTIGTSSVIGVTFSETNTASNPTLNVNGLGDWPIVADNNAIDIKHYLPFGVRIIFKRFRNTWKITNTKDCLQYILSDAVINLAGSISTTYNNGDFNFGNYIISQGTGCISTNVYNATQYNINGTNIFDGIRTITQPWVYTATQSIKLTTTLGGSVYQDKGIKFTDTNNASIGYLYGCTFNSGNSGVGISASNVIDNTTVSKGVRVVLTNDGKSYLYPGNPDDTSLGSEYFTWKGVYANKYYLGNTEFGDIVTHNASEFLTEHQSLTNYATKQDLADLVNSAPSTLDTLNELASALGNDPNFATTVSTQIGTKANDNAVVHLSGNETINGTKIFKSDKLISTSGNSYRIINNSNNSSDGYGVFQRIDSGNWYLMLTAKDDALGSWASPRPAVMSLSTGVLNINGNSATATEFSTNKDVTLTGDVTGTASSKAGWTVSTTLANSGVSAGTYTNVTVDAKGRVTSGNARHSYTVTSTSKAWFRLANATSSPLDTDNPPHVQFILRAYNTSLGVQYYQEWIVDAKVFGSQSGLQIFGSSGNPFQYGRILYEATTSNVTNDTKPCIDIYLNNASKYATNIEIIELYNTGFEFVSGNTLSVSYTPSGFESRQVAIVQSGVSNSDWANYATRTQINRSDISSNITLADTHRGTCLNCTNNLTVNVPSLNSALCWFIIKNVTNDKKVTIHPATSVTIDGYNNDIVLRPKESITILSRSSNNFVIINDNRRRTAVVGRTVAVTGATKHWFLVAETTVSIAYADIYASFKVFKASGTYQASGILSLHVRVDSTIGVSSNRQLQWEYNNDTSTLPLENFAITTTETSGDNIKVQLWYKGEGSYSSCKFVMLAEQGTSDYLDNPIWKLTRFRKSTADADMETLDTGFTTTTYSSLMSIVNPIPAIDTCLKNVVTNNQIIKSTGITRGTAPSSAQTFGIAFSDKNNKYIGNIYGQFATDKSTYVGLYAYKGTTTSNGDNAYLRVGYDASGNVYTSAPTPATTDNSTQIATTAFVKAQGYLTSHQSLANYVTTNTDQSISGIKSHSKHISILGDYVGNESSTNGRSCLYLKANRDTDGKSGLYVTKFRQNVAQGSMGNSDVVFLSHDILENETRTNAGFVESYSNWTNDVPGGMSIYSSIATRNLGTSAKPWTNAYITNLNLNGNAFDPTSIDGIGTTRLLAYEPASTTDLSNPAGTTKSGSALYDVRMTLHNATGDSGIFDSSSSGTFSVTIDKNRTQPGTWKVLHYISVGVPSVSHTSFAIAMWVRIA